MRNMLDSAAFTVQYTPTKMPTPRVNANHSHMPLLAERIRMASRDSKKNHGAGSFFCAGSIAFRTNTKSAIAAHTALSTTEGHACLTLR